MSRQFASPRTSRKMLMLVKSFVFNRLRKAVLIKFLSMAGGFYLLTMVGNNAYTWLLNKVKLS